MRFHRSFDAAFSISQRYRARFKLNRYPLRRQHQALDTAFSPERLLFPPTTSQQTVPSVDSIRKHIYNPLIAANSAQLQAVTSITLLPKGSLTFFIFGP